MYDAPFPVIAHPYESPVSGAVAYEIGLSEAQNALIFVGGLTDGPHTVGYIRRIAKYLQDKKELSYSVFEVRIRSSFMGFGTSSLMKDVEDISALVKYLRSKGKKKVVLMGHSTGCQDCMEYTNYEKHPNNSIIDGFILQAPVSDREGIDRVFPGYQDSLDLAQQLMAQGKGNDCIPQDKGIPSLDVPISAYRLISLIGKNGDDDYFSSDLDDDRVKKFWGFFNKPVLVLHSGNEEYVPSHISQEALSQRYQKANPLVSSLSGLIPNANHAVEDEDARQWLAERVSQFLATIEEE